MHVVSPGYNVTVMAADGAVSQMRVREHKVSFHAFIYNNLDGIWVSGCGVLPRMHLIMPLPVMDLLKRTQISTLSVSQVLTNCEM